MTFERFSRLTASKMAILFALFTLILSAYGAQAQANPKYASIVMDADTGAILHQRYADKKLHPASMTKAMTLIMLFDAMERGEVKLTDRIIMSPIAAKAVPSKLGLAPGTSIRVKDAILALVTKSANDVAVAMGEHLAGTESEFARQMTARARAMGMHSTTFRNASGLHDPRQVSTARDMAKMARALIFNYPKYYPYFSTTSFTYQGKTYGNHNRLMKTYAGMDGLKTGYVNASGFNLVASAVRDNRRIIGVVFGGRSSATRNAHMKDLLDNGFAKIKTMPVQVARAPTPQRKPGADLMLASLVSPKAVENVIKTADAAGDKFAELMGEGDLDPEIKGRLETGLLAIAAHKGENPAARLAMLNGQKQDATAAGIKVASLANRDLRPAPVTNLARRNSRNTGTNNQSWSIQVGAFKSRASTDQALHHAMQKLPKTLSGDPIIAPLKTGQGWLYRGRIQGFDKTSARKACALIKDCMPIAPQG